MSSGCKKVSNSKKVAEEFYKSLTEHNYEDLLPLLSDDVREKKTDKKWDEVFTKRDNYWGTVKSYDNTFSEIKQTSIGTVVELRYKVENTDGTTYELLRFMEENGEMKIIFYSYSDNPDFITSSMEEDDKPMTIKSFPTQEETIQKFYDLFKSKDYDAMNELFREDVRQGNSSDGLKKMMIKKSDYYGEISSIDKYFADKLESDSGYFYKIIYKVTYKSGKTLYEKFEFSCETEPDKIMFFIESEDPETL